MARRDAPHGFVFSYGCAAARDSRSGSRVVMVGPLSRLPSGSAQQPRIADCPGCGGEHPAGAVLLARPRRRGEVCDVELTEDPWKP